MITTFRIKALACLCVRALPHNMFHVSSASSDIDAEVQKGRLNLAQFYTVYSAGASAVSLHDAYPRFFIFTKNIAAQRLPL